jgi:hypothetical protein
MDSPGVSRDLTARILSIIITHVPVLRSDREAEWGLKPIFPCWVYSMDAWVWGFLDAGRVQYWLVHIFPFLG